MPTPSLTPVEIDVAADFDDRLRNSLGSGGLLVLVTQPRRLERCADELARLPVTVVDVADSIHHELGARCTGARVWGPSARFDGQQVGRGHELQDGDSVEILD